MFKVFKKKIPTFVLSAQSSLQTPVNCNFWIFCVLNPDLHPPFGYGSRRSPIMGIWIQKVYHNNADSKHRFCCICEPRKTSWSFIKSRSTFSLSEKTWFNVFYIQQIFLICTVVVQDIMIQKQLWDELSSVGSPRGV